METAAQKIEMCGASAWCEPAAHPDDFQKMMSL